MYRQLVCSPLKLDMELLAWQNTTTNFKGILFSTLKNLDVNKRPSIVTNKNEANVIKFIVEGASLEFMVFIKNNGYDYVITLPTIQQQPCIPYILTKHQTQRMELCQASSWKKSRYCVLCSIKEG